MAICGTVAYPPLPPEEEKVLSLQKNKNLNDNVMQFVSMQYQIHVFPLFFADESTETTHTQTPMGIKKSPLNVFGWVANGCNSPLLRPTAQ